VTGFGVEFVWENPTTCPRELIKLAQASLPVPLDSTGTETILHNFAGGTSDGCYRSAGVTLDSDGNLFGVTRYCGAEDYRALYELSASGVFILLHSFQRSDGAGPMGEVLRTAKGRLYGTTTTGGSHNYGTVWSYVP
jgi:uncharacterized repeat protein (TIGR03803 family)